MRVISEFRFEFREGIWPRLDHDQSLRRDAIEQHAGPLSDVCANIDNILQRLSVPRREKRQSGLFSFMHEPVASPPLGHGQFSSDVAQYPPVSCKIDAAVGQNELQ